jgi:hypothetical protein
MFGIDDAILMGGANLLGGIFSNNANRQAAESAQQFSAQQYATRYQTQVADMKAAGLNPMLAYQQSPGSSPQGVSYQTQNPAVGAASAYQSVKAGQVSPSQTTLNEASAAQAAANSRVADQTVDKIKAEIPNINSQTLNLDEQRRVIVETAKLIAQQIGLTKEQSSLTKEQIYQSQTQANLNVAQRQQAEATVKRLVAETKLFGFDISATEDLGNLGREAGQLKPIFDIFRGLLRK